MLKDSLYKICHVFLFGDVSQRRSPRIFFLGIFLFYLLFKSIKVISKGNILIKKITVTIFTLIHEGDFCYHIMPTATLANLWVLLWSRITSFFDRNSKDYQGKFQWEDHYFHRNVSKIWINKFSGRKTCYWPLPF